MKKLLLILMLLAASGGAAYAQKITIPQLPAATTPLAGTELVPLSQGGTTVQTAISNIAKPSGSSGQVQFNSSNSFAGSAALSFDTSTGNLLSATLQPAANTTAMTISGGSRWRRQDRLRQDECERLDAARECLHDRTVDHAERQAAALHRYDHQAALPRIGRIMLMKKLILATLIASALALGSAHAQTLPQPASSRHTKRRPAA